VGRLDDIAERNERALRDTRHRLVWVAVIVLALVAIGVALAMGVGMPEVHKHTKAVPVLLRSAPADKP
jgi:hypothetical protein